MNDEIKQAAEKYELEVPYESIVGSYHAEDIRVAFMSGASYANEKYQEEIIELKDRLNRLVHNPRYVKELEEKLSVAREALEFTVHAAEYLYKPDVKLNRGMTPTFYFTLTYDGDLELIEKTKRAREALEKIGKI